ncbi:3'-5' exonuclease [Jannaschia seohaensis]|uniref:DNA-directed DNA polymerase n=1 Tax=Jannaschia seohaensis TaxID=475081 RepID=A0A2Y9A9Y1_9RHOB|nr:exonuclease domain-containing protein [Jannaschia seohaensis]PWJ20924.1 DNA polymerase-3 subunit epsilon [Jannaschia seohaensis]SSA41334.1 DNA polymerase-3 subunit epsilon [Jannaschia seohaensis]
MLARLPLRLRIFLFFGFLALGGAALAAGALWLGWSRSEGAAGPFVTAFLVFAFLNTGLALAVFLLFDEHVAKPIDRLSADLRLRAHSGVDAALSTDAARWLGDLAPAADALSRSLGDSVMETADKVARETERLRTEAARLTALLTEIPIATILLNPRGEIVLYDGQAADVLSQIAPPRLKAPLTDYFERDALDTAIAALPEAGGEIPLTLRALPDGSTHQARLKPLAGGGHMVLIDAQGAPIAPRPLVFDFDLMEATPSRETQDTPLRDLCYIPFDTETTGLSVESDAIIQIGAVRVLGGRIVEGEVLDTYVDPGRPIPALSTRIHGIRDADVTGAPKIETAGRALHHFARDAVLVAHNAPFDIGLLRRDADRMGVAWSHPVLDTVLLSAVVFGTTAEHSLDALCARLDVTIPAELRHTALGDARATGQALVRLLPLLEGKGIETFGQLIAETRKHGRLLNDLNV